MKKPLLAALLLACASAAQAQATRMMMPEGTYDLYFGLALGTSLRSDSEGGSRSQLLPALNVQWSNGVYAEAGTRGGSVGMHLSDNPIIDYGVMVSMSERDQRSDTPGQRGGAAVQAGGFWYWAVEHNISIGGDLQAGGGFDRGGLLGHARISYATPLAVHHSGELEIGAYAADHSWMQGYFGVSPQQAASGNNPVYRASAGVVSVYGEAYWSWHFSNKYHLGSGLRFSRLVGSAAASPLVGKRNRVSLGTSLTYHF
jgi:outer membrane protein